MPWPVSLFRLRPGFLEELADAEHRRQQRHDGNGARFSESRAYDPHDRNFLSLVLIRREIVGITQGRRVPTPAQCLDEAHGGAHPATKDVDGGSPVIQGDGLRYDHGKVVGNSGFVAG